LVKFPNLLGGFNKKKEDPAKAREALKSEFLAEADGIKTSVNDVILNDKARQFFKLVRRSFRKLFGINYECTFDELKSELECKVSEKGLKNDLRVFLEELEHFEYGFPGFEDEQRRVKAKEKQEIFHYLHELEAEGKKIDKKLEKDVEELFQDDVSDSTRLLVKFIHEFEELLKRI